MTTERTFTAMTLDAAIDAVLANMHASLVEQHKRAVAADLKEWEARCKEVDKGEGPIYTGIYSLWPSLAFPYKAQAMRHTIGEILVGESIGFDPASGRVYAHHHRDYIPADVAARTEAAAQRYATDSLAGFKAKMHRKLSDLGAVQEVAYSHFGTAWESTLRLTYARASMLVDNSVVLKFSKYGKAFNQFPARFHAVVIDGQPMKTPSEAKVKKAMQALATA